MLTKNIFRHNIIRLISDIILVYIIYAVCRITFLLENWSTFSTGMTGEVFKDIWTGGLRFDTAAICYTNSLFVLLFLITGFLKKIPGWYQLFLKWLFVAVNSLCLVIDLADSVFFAYRLQRSSYSTILEFQNEGNLATIGGIEVIKHWYLLILGAILIYSLFKLYLSPQKARTRSWRSITGNIALIAIMTILSLTGMRSSWVFNKVNRPISVSFASRYVKEPLQTALVLNTPYSLIRTAGHVAMEVPKYFSEEELDAIFTPVNIPSDTLTQRRKNVVILILESFGQEFVGSLNPDLDGGTYKGYTPFLDSLLSVSTHWSESFANAGFSIDASPAILASIPRMKQSFVLTPASLNELNSIPSILKKDGYSSAFFLGAENESLGIHAFTDHIGYEKYYGRDEFYADPRFGGKDQFDGTWGVWDEPFLQYFAAQLSEMKQPFVGTLFTLTSHHPFNIPDKYRAHIPDDKEFPIKKAITYTDLSLRHFFDTARKQPWYDNTIFILTADHTNAIKYRDEYKSEIGRFRIPILIFDPSGELPRGEQPGIVQQADLMPTLLNYLGNRHPYISFGKDMFATPSDSTWAFNWQHIPQYISGDYILQFDEQNRGKALYDYRQDPMLKNNLLDKGIPQQKEMETRGRAIIQSYMQRMNSNNAVIR